jgi:prepilin-type N-terminal cleavage/methylation domain-containing protein
MAPPMTRPVGSMSHAEPASRRTGFTLLELLVVTSIIAILAGMAMPMLAMARRVAARTNTQSLLRKVDGALHQYKVEVGSFPYIAWDAAADPTTPPDNRLAWFLAHDMSDDELATLRKDVDDAGAAYEPGGSARLTSAVLDQRMVDGYSANNSKTSDVMHLNRLARQWARTNMMAGNSEVHSTMADAGNPWVDKVPLISAPRSKGFAKDYLSREVLPQQIAGDDLLDMWRRPLLYICPVQPGVVGYYAEGGNRNSSSGDACYIDPAWYGFGARTLRAETKTRNSDLRTTAAPGFAARYELWSGGPDRRLDAARTDQVNRDNIPAERYDRGLD